MLEHATHTLNVSYNSPTLPLCVPQGKLTFGSAGGQAFFVSTYFVRSVVKSLLQSTAGANLGTKKGVLAFLKRKPRSVLDNETWAKFTGLMDKIVRGAFDTSLMEWAGLHANYPQLMTTPAVKKYVDTTLDSFLGSLLCAPQYHVT
jgi:hypothetical protein